VVSTQVFAKILKHNQQVSGMKWEIVKITGDMK